MQIPMQISLCAQTLDIGTEALFEQPTGIQQDRSTCKEFVHLFQQPVPIFLEKDVYAIHALQI